MHIRSKPWARPELAACPFFVESFADAEAVRGRWHGQYPHTQPLWVEFGCGKGGFLASMALSRPDVNFLGVDIKSDVLGNARRNIAAAFGETPVDNLRLTAFDVERLPLYMDARDAVSRILVNFPNPWDRPAEHKRRLTCPKYLERYRVLLAPGGEVWFKTDDLPLWEDTRAYFAECGFETLAESRDLRGDALPESAESPETEHERMFAEQGRPVLFLRAKMV